MRWYVSRNGETQGPLEEAIVAEWVRAGMRDAMVRDEASSAWVQIPQSPFATLLPVAPQPAISVGGLGQAVGGLVFLGGVAGAVHFYLFFDASVPTGMGERVMNLSLMQQQQQGTYGSMAAVVIGLVLMIALRRRP